MTLAQLATFITNKIQKTDTTAVAVCKSFLKQRYQMIWEKETWGDSKTTVTASCINGTSDFTCDSTIELVTQVIWKNTPLTNVNLENMFRYRPDWQTAIGKPIYYMIRPKSVAGRCVIRFDVLPDETQNVITTGKLVFTPLSTDSDVPLLRGIDNTLLAFCEGDMLEYIQQRQTAKGKYEEAQALFQEMLDLELQQQTKILQIVPSSNDWNYPQLVTTSQGWTTESYFLRGP